MEHIEGIIAECFTGLIGLLGAIAGLVWAIRGKGKDKNEDPS